ncbi:ATP-dependent helicase [Oribacterium sp. FC2011]|uniref:ATP-dependent helicase n=1 Tax=Oribacterium sp. FC2011 TaxID=1408311 RepID=UPI0004E10583|nr:ATP-dependent helicase [Oribacterium sp. FC2011]
MVNNESQQKVIDTIYGQMGVIAVPGAGKTSTSIRRIKNMIDKGIKGENILMVTFTDAAAKEMRSKFARMYGENGVIFSTIHSMCLKILNEFRTIPVNIISYEEQLRIAKDCLTFHRPKRPIQKKDLLMDISTYKNSDCPVNMFTPLSLEKEDFEPIYRRYEVLKEECGKNDFDDLLILTRELLKNHPAILSHVRERFRFIIVDEYQDTNKIQAELIYLIAGPEGNISVVGDDDQSIYGFRGALPNIMFEFFEHYPKALKVDMGINYRSEPEIIESADRLIQFNKKRFKKDFSAFKSGKGSVNYKTYDERCEEIDAVLDMICKVIRNGGQPGHNAILTRTNQQLDDIAAGLDDRNIPYITADSIPDIYRHFIFADIMSYLKLADGTGTKADVMKVINRPNRYIPEKVVANIHELNADSLKKALPTSDNDRLNDIRNGNCYSFFGDIERLKRITFKKRVKYIAETIGYRKFLYKYASEIDLIDSIFVSKLDFFMNDSSKYDDINSWYNAAYQHVIKHDSMLKKRAENAVFLGTMHRSKGLEWENVFLVDVNKTIVPFKKAVSNAEIEEERRLFYVGITRAKKNCYVFNYLSKTGGKNHACKPSPFIEEMNGKQFAILKRSEQQNEEKQKLHYEMYSFKEGSTRDFYNGQEVHHKTMRKGIVTGKNSFFVRVSFDAGSKTFPLV